MTETKRQTKDPDATTTTEIFLSELDALEGFKIHKSEPNKIAIRRIFKVYAKVQRGMTDDDKLTSQTEIGP